MSTMKDLRRAKHLTQIELARRARVGIQTVYRMEKGVEVLPVTAEAVARVLGVRLDEVSDVNVVVRVK